MVGVVRPGGTGETGIDGVGDAAGGREVRIAQGQAHLAHGGHLEPDFLFNDRAGGDPP